MTGPGLRKVAARLTLGTLGASLSTEAALADGYVLGAGRWTCGELVRELDAENTSAKLQAAGWVLGYWTAATFQRETSFIGTVEKVGGNVIWDKTVEECRKAPADTMLYRVADAMISNTK